jgi:hypothetical protein
MVIKRQHEFQIDTPQSQHNTKQLYTAVPGNSTAQKKNGLSGNCARWRKAKPKSFCCMTPFIGHACHGKAVDTKDRIAAAGGGREVGVRMKGHTRVLQG